MSKRALITGISGQDGSYLSELLLSKGYDVYGIIRRHSTPENQHSRIDHLADVEFLYGDMTDMGSLMSAIKMARPDEIYNLAAQSHVRISFDIPQYTTDVNALGVVNLLTAIRALDWDCRIYQASSSEMFGNSVDSDGMQRETTPMHPASPYGCAKLFSYSLMRNYRKAYGMFTSNGILFNHESPRRGTNFVTTKIVKSAWQIKKGMLDKLELGNLDAKRDWGHSRDYVRAMHKILQHNAPDDFVIATGQAANVRYICEYVFGKLGMDYRDYVTTNPKFLRPEELQYLCGDSTKARTILGWRPVYSIEMMLDEIIEKMESVVC